MVMTQCVYVMFDKPPLQNGNTKFPHRCSNTDHYPMTYILSESEATITRGIWSHIPFPPRGLSNIIMDNQISLNVMFGGS